MPGEPRSLEAVARHLDTVPVLSGAPHRTRRWRPPVPLAHRTLGPDDAALATRLLRDRSSWYDDARVVQYEDEFSDFNASRFALAFASGRVAMSAALHGLDVPPGAEVLLPGYTCVVVDNAIRFAGLKPVYADIELETYGPALESVVDRTTQATRVLLLQHSFGLVSRDYEALLLWARQNHIWVVEDCTHATGARWLGQRLGTRGDVAFYSSEQSKVFNTIQGGMVVTDNAHIAERMSQFWRDAQPSGERFTQRLLRSVVRGWAGSNRARAVTLPAAARAVPLDPLVSTSEDEVAGRRPAHYGRRMNGAVSQLGRRQLSKVDRNNARRRDRAAHWQAWAEEHGYVTPTIMAGSDPAFLRYPVLVPAQMKVDTAWGRSLGVQVGRWFVSPLHPRVGVDITDCPNADYAVKHCVNLPTL